MNQKIEKLLPGTNGWRLFLESAETMLKLPSLQTQADHLTRTVDALFGYTCEFWYAHPLYPLPGEAKPRLIGPENFPSKFAALVYKDRKPVFIINEKRITRNLIGNEPVLEACLPVLCDRDLIGVLHVKPNNGQPIISTRFEELQSYLSINALPMQIYRQTILKNWRVTQLALVREISEKTANTTNLQQLCEQVADAVQEKFGYYYLAIYTTGGKSLLDCQSSSSAIHPDRQSPKIESAPGQGIVGWVADNHQELYVEDTCCDPIYRFHELLPEAKSEAAFPLMVGENCVGVLDVQSDKTGAFHEMDLVVLRTLADNIAIAVENARMFSGVQRQAEQIATVVDISHALSSILDLDTLLDEIVNTIQKKFGYLQVNVFTVHKGRGKIIFQSGTGENSKVFRDSYLTININDPNGILSWVAREGRTFLSNNVIDEPQYRKPDIPTTARSELSVPLIVGNEVVGILDIQSEKTNAFDLEDVYLFEALSAGIATAIRNATLFRSESFRRHVAESVRDIAGILSNGSSITELMNRILKELRTNLPCDAASIWLAEDTGENGSLLTLAAIDGILPDQLRHTTQTRSNTSTWVIDALDSVEPVIRKITDPRGPLGDALDMPEDYSAIAAPLRAGGKCVGLLTLAHHQPGRYGSEARLITQTFAGYAAVAIQNSRLYTSTQEQAWIASTLLQIADENRNVRTFNELAERTTHIVPELIGATNCAFFQFNPLLDCYERLATNGFPVDSLPSKCFDKNHPAFLEASNARVPTPVCIENRGFTLNLNRIEQCGLFVPLTARDKHLGILWIGNSNSGQPYSKRIIQILTGISHQTATAMENLQYMENQEQDVFISSVLLKTSQAISSQNNLNNILGKIMDILSKSSGVDSSVFFLIDLVAKGFKPVFRQQDFNNEDSRTLGNHLFLGDFPFLDSIIGHNQCILAPLNKRQRSVPHWLMIKQMQRVKEALRQKPPESGWLIGVPLVGKNEIYGALIVLEKPLSGTILEKKIDLLTGIAKQTALALQNDQFQQERIQTEAIQQEYKFARTIQQTFLPRSIPHVKGWDIASYWQPANQVGGDFFDVITLPNGDFYTVIADVSDKGMPAALYMTVTRTLFRSFALEKYSPGQILSKVNDLLLQDNPTGMFVTSAIIFGSSSTGEIIYANAGHHPPVMKNESDHLVEFPRGQIALGVLGNQTYLNHMISITPDSMVVLYTDGVIDTISPAGESFSVKRLMDMVKMKKYRKSRDFTTVIENDLEQFRAGQPSVDDITLLVLHRL